MINIPSFKNDFKMSKKTKPTKNEHVIQYQSLLYKKSRNKSVDIKKEKANCKSLTKIEGKYNSSTSDTKSNAT